MATRDRFVILHHRGFGREHWDLGLEHGNVLLTWRLPRLPADSEPFPVPADRIGDHRRLYLEYEGPLSGDRGEVTRVDRGELDIQEITGRSIRFRADGGVLSGLYRLRREGPRWTLEKVDRSTWSK